MSRPGSWSVLRLEPGVWSVLQLLRSESGIRVYALESERYTHITAALNAARALTDGTLLP